MTSPSAERIIATAQGHWASRALLAAVELDLFTVVAEGPLDTESLRQRLRIHERGARDFFDGLVALGFLERDADGRYTNTPESDCFLDRGKPSSLCGYLEFLAARFRLWDRLTEALRSGLPQVDPDTAQRRFHAIYGDPARLEQFVRGMTGSSLPVAEAIARSFSFGEYETFFDIGTAEGCLPVAVAKAHPHLRGGGFDLPPVRPVFERYVASHGLQDRLRFEPGDFFRDDLPSADVLALGRVLHNWDLPTKRMLLAKAYAALPPGGAIIVFERMIDDARRRNATGLLASLNMLLSTPGGFDATCADIALWLKEAGFEIDRVESLPLDHSMVVGVKPRR